jgi:predicted small lipoprotein YifL
MKDKVMRILGIMLLLVLMLQGCGRKAPLFLPPPAVPKTAPQAASQVVPAQPSAENPESKK